MAGELAAALAAFQAEAPSVPKSKRATVPTKSGGSYSYTYADLADVADVAYPVLAKHGLAFACGPELTPDGWALTGRLLHSSGEEVTGTLPLHGRTPQEMGSSLTYMRRYLLGCLTGIVTDDDDDAQGAQAAPRAGRGRSARDVILSHHGGDFGAAVKAAEAAGFTNLREPDQAAAYARTLA